MNEQTQSRIETITSGREDELRKEDLYVQSHRKYTLRSAAWYVYLC